jgi:septal ring factor EnvC (AmiA/AmiB activator)
MSTPTPRTDAAWAKTFEDDDDQCRAGNAATDMRDACATLERELAALTTERDHLHAQLRALTLICGTNDANKFETWIDRANARAERAEAELAAERARLDWLEMAEKTDHAHCPENDGQRWRFPYLMDGTGGFGGGVGHKYFDTLRAAIDAAMKKDVPINSPLDARP